MIQTPHTWIEINRNALAYNLKMYKQAIGNKELGVVVKSNAYGHGILEVARTAKKAQMLIGFLPPHYPKQ